MSLLDGETANEVPFDLSTVRFLSCLHCSTKSVRLRPLAHCRSSWCFFYLSIDPISSSSRSHLVHPMDQTRDRLSCPGRVQDWLGAAVGQIETLLLVPQPSLSGSDQAIGALRIKRERPSRATGPYNLRPTTATPAFDTETPSTAHHIASSASFDFSRLLYAEKPLDRCENCVAEKGSRCSRDLPSCTRCVKIGTVCSYVEGVPAGRRKLRGRRCERTLPVRSLLETRPASKDPALSALETCQVVQPVSYHTLETSAALRVDSKYPQPPPEQYSSVLDLVSVWGGKEDAPENHAGSGIHGGPAHLAPIQSQSRSPLRAASVSLATTPFSSTLGSRSTSQSSGADSWPITPAAELPAPLGQVNMQQAVDPDVMITSSRTSSDSYTTPSVPRDVPVLYLLAHDRPRAVYDAVPSTELEDGTFSDEFLEELFEEGDAAKRLVESQRYSQAG